MRSFENLARPSVAPSVVDDRGTSYRRGSLTDLRALGMIGMNLGNMSRIGSLSLLVAAAAACSDMAPDEDTYTAVYGLGSAGGSGSATGMGGTDNAGTGGTPEPTGPLPPEWACLDEPQPVVDRMPSRIQYRVPIVDFDTQTSALTAVAGLVVQVCGNASCDPALPPCPAGGATTPIEQCFTQINPLPVPYVYEFDLPWQFTNGILKLTAPGYAEMNYIFGGPMIGPPEGGSLVIGLPIPLLRNSARANAYLDCGVSSVDPTRGTVAVRTLDCRRNLRNLSMTVPEGSRAPMVTVSALDEVENGVAWALSNDNTFSPNTLQTDPRGVAGYLDTDVGVVRLVAEAPIGRQYPAAPPNLRVRPNVITLAELRDGLGRWGQ
jgi:hypothetical protein